MSNNRRRRNRGSANARAALGANGIFTFTHGGKTFTLPPAADAAGKVKAGNVIDAVMGDSDLAEMRLGLATLQAVGPSAEAMAALRDMDMAEFGSVIERWMKQTGADPGESPRSST